MVAESGIVWLVGRGCCTSQLYMWRRSVQITIDHLVPLAGQVMSEVTPGRTSRLRCGKGSTWRNTSRLRPITIETAVRGTPRKAPMTTQPRSRKGLGCGLAVLGFVIILGIIGANTSSNGTQTAATSDTSTTEPAAPTTDTTTTGPGVNPVAVAIVAWVNGGGQDRVDAISSDFSNIATGIAAADSPAVNAACVSLRSHVEKAQAYAPVPSDWSAALAQAARSATDCIAGTDTLNASLISRSGHELKATTAAIVAMTTRLKTFQ